MKKGKITIFLFGALIAAAIPSLSFGATIYQTTDSGGGLGNLASFGNVLPLTNSASIKPSITACTGGSIGYFITSADISVSDIQAFFEPAPADTNVHLEIQEYLGASQPAIGTSQTYTASHDIGVVSYHFNTPVNLIGGGNCTTAGHLYQLQVSGTNTSAANSHTAAEDSNAAFLVFSSINAPATPTIDFFYPKASSSVPLFSPWLLTADNLISGDTYKVQLDWYATYVSGAKTDTFTKVVYKLGHDIRDHGISIPRTDFMFDIATSSTITATARLFDTQDPNNPTASLAQPILIDTKTISFTLLSKQQSNDFFAIPSFPINASGTIAGLTSTSTPNIASSSVSAQETNATSTDIICEAPPDGAGLGQQIAYGFCKVGSALFRPSEQSTQRLIDSFDGFKTDFPFVYFYSTAETFKSGLASTTATTAPLVLNIMNTHITILSTSTISDFTGSTFKDWMFTLEKWLMWMVVAFAILKIIH